MGETTTGPEIEQALAELLIRRGKLDRAGLERARRAQDGAS